MLELSIGAALGMLSGLGVGGGSLLLLWLTLVMGLPQETARLMNLMFFLPCAVVATALRWRHSRPDWQLALPAAAAGAAGALLGSFLRPLVDAAMLKRALGAVFLLCGIRELRYQPKK